MTNLVTPPAVSVPLRHRLRRGARQGLVRSVRLTQAICRAGAARVMTRTPRGPRFAGAFPDRAAAIASLPADRAAGYDDEGIAEISFEQMCERMPWDYPMILWLERLTRGEAPVRVVDAGGHMGTKYIAFSGVMDLSGIEWIVHDLPGIVAAARAAQAAGRIPAALRFEARPQALPAADIVIASGLLQYLDQPFSSFIDQLAAPPRHILVNKVAVRPDRPIFTIERIGRARVPYHVRSVTDWHAEIAAMGYRVLDSWRIPDLGHVIPTHPWLGRSESRGYVLQRVANEAAAAADRPDSRA